MQIIEIAREVTGYRKMVIPLKRKAIRIMGLFDVFMNEIIEMMYLTEKGFILSGEEYRRRIGPITKTPFKTGLEETLHILTYQKDE